MKIDDIKINGFGKIKNKEIELKDGINIIYGENESGKSTILKFISASLFGVSKNKNGKTISDFEQYKPWDDSEFSGKIKYTLQDGQQYEVFREFKKKNPVIYNQFGEDISKQFDVSKTKGINFLEQQIGIDEISLSNTAMIEQQEVKLEKNDTNQMLQKISNLVSTGHDNISFKKAIEKMNKMQNEQIGTDRTKQRPINIVNDKIKELSEQKKKLNSEKESMGQHAEKKEKIHYELNQANIRKEELKQMKKTMDESRIQSIEQKMKIKNYVLLVWILSILTTVLTLVLKKVPLIIIPAILVMIAVLLQRKARKSLDNTNINLDTKQIDKELEKIENKVNDLIFQKHIVENEKQNMDEKIEKLTKIEENLVEQKQIHKELMSLNTSFELAKECLNQAYEEIKHSISPRFEKNLCEIIADITDGKYQKITVNDENGLYVEVENGRYMPAERLSIGTIDEMYLSFRLSMLSEITKESMPIILDETFAFFDKNRLKNVMRYLQDKNYDNQIIIFTCSNREEEVLNELKIEYHLINCV